MENAYQSWRPTTELLTVLDDGAHLVYHETYPTYQHITLYNKDKRALKIARVDKLSDEERAEVRFQMIKDYQDATAANLCSTKRG